MFIDGISMMLLTVPLLMVIPLALAVALNKKFRGRNAVRAIFFAPFVLGVAVIGLLWRYLLDPNVGVINYYLDQLGIDRIPFTTATPWVWVALVVPRSDGLSLRLAPFPAFHRERGLARARLPAQRCSQRGGRLVPSERVEP